MVLRVSGFSSCLETLRNTSLPAALSSYGGTWPSSLLHALWPARGFQRARQAPRSGASYRASLKLLPVISRGSRRAKTARGLPAPGCLHLSLPPPTPGTIKRSFSKALACSPRCSSSGPPRVRPGRVPEPELFSSTPKGVRGHQGKAKEGLECSLCTASALLSASLSFHLEALELPRRCLRTALPAPTAPALWRSRTSEHRR